MVYVASTLKMLLSLSKSLVNLVDSLLISLLIWVFLWMVMSLIINGDMSIFLEDLITFHWPHQMAICWLKISTLRYLATFTILSWNNSLNKNKNLFCSSSHPKALSLEDYFRTKWGRLSEKLSKISGGILVSEIYPILSNVSFSV